MLQNWASASWKSPDSHFIRISTEFTDLEKKKEKLNFNSTISSKVTSHIAVPIVMPPVDPLYS